MTSTVHATVHATVLEAILDGQRIQVDCIPDTARTGPKRLRVVAGPRNLSVVDYPCIVLEVENSSYMLDNPRLVGDQLHYDAARKQW